MKKSQVEAIAIEAEQLVKDQCGKLVQSMLEMNYADNERDAFVRLASSNLLGGACDLFLEMHHGNAAALQRLVGFRIEAKKHRDLEAKKRDLH